MIGKLRIGGLVTTLVAAAVLCNPAVTLADELNTTIEEPIVLEASSSKESIADADRMYWYLSQTILLNSEVPGIKDMVTMSWGWNSSPNKDGLVRGVDYEVDGPIVSGEDGTVTVRGVGEYAGEVTLQFKVVDSLDLNDATVGYEGSFGDMFYTGERIAPQVRSVFVHMDEYRFNRQLTTDDYVVSYGDNTNLGVAYVLVKPSGNGVCSGEHRDEINIVRREDFVLDGTGNLAYVSEMRIDPEQRGDVYYDCDFAFPYRGAPITPAVVISVSKPAYEPTDIQLVEGVDYVLSYKNNDRPGTATVTAEGIGGIAGSISCEFQIASGKIDVSTLELDLWDFEQGQYEYTGSPIEPKLRFRSVRSARDKAPLLLDEGDVRYSYSNNVAIGACKVTVTGAGDCLTGSTTIDVPIVAPGTLPERPASLDECTVDPIDPITYDGCHKKPKIVLRGPSGEALPDHYYYVTYDNNLNVGTGYAYVSGSWAKDGTGVRMVTGSTIKVPFQIVGGGSGPDLSKDGWLTLPSGGKGYAKGGALVTGWMDVGSSKYWFGEDCRMATGWTDVEVSGKVMHYYFNPASGNLVRGTWFQIGGVTYYFRPSGNLATGWATIGDNGVDKKYYFEEDGTLVRGAWRDVDNGQGVTNHHYFRPSGAMATGWATIGGEKYFFRPSGNMATGFADVPEDAFKRYFDASGRMVTGWQSIGGNRYYFRASGAMQTGTATIDGKSYTFSGKGVLVG